MNTKVTEKIANAKSFKRMASNYSKRSMEAKS